MSESKMYPGGMPAGAAGGMAAAIMPTPSTGAGGDAMPRPGAVAGGGTQDTMPRPSGQGPGDGDMPRPGGMGGGGTDVPRFGPPGRPSGPMYEPGVVEVQFREGLLPSVTLVGAEGAPSLESRSAPNDAALAAVNQILQRYRLVGAEPTFTRTVEEGDQALAAARQQGIDVPHLADFVTLRFPPDANVIQIAAELCSSPQVARAVPVPTARPPAEVMDAPPRGVVFDPTREAPGLREEVRPGREVAAPSPLAEPLAGSSDQATIDPNTGLENQWYLFRCRANNAWSMSTGANVVIADVDWGYRTSHEEWRRTWPRPITPSTAPAR